MRKLWLLCSSFLLALMYFFSVNVSYTSDHVTTTGPLSMSAGRNVVVEVGTQVKKVSEKQEVRYRNSNVFLPFLPVISVAYIANTLAKKHFRVIQRLFYNSAQVPSLGANAPPVYMY